MKKGIKPGIISLLLLVGCKISHQMKLEPEPFLKWYSSDENPFKATDTLNDICYNIISYPKEVSIALCALNNCEPEEVLLTDLKSKSGVSTYLLELKSLNLQRDLFESSSKQLSKNDQMLYLNNDIKYDLKALTEGGDTLKCISVIYEPLLSNKFRLMIDFESPRSGSIAQIVFTDKLVSQSQIRFAFTKNNHSNFPLLNLNNYEK